MRRLLPLLALLLLTLAACGETESGGATAPQTGAQTTTFQSPETTAETTAAAPPEPDYGYTYSRPSGNLAVEGVGNLPGSEPVDIPLGGAPVWVTGVPLGDDTAWVVALEDGRVEAFRLEGSGELSSVPVTPERIPPGEPPLVRAEGGSLELVTASGSDLTHPAPLPGGEGMLVVGEDGRVSADGEELPVTALPDARAVRAADGRLALLTSPTRRYDHGVLGDGIEAGSMTVLRPDGAVAGSFQAASGGVFEEVAPLWTEISGETALAVTESTPDAGSRVSLYGPDGELMAAGPFMGQPFRWRHLLAAGPFGPEGQTEVVAVQTPHLSSVVEFYRPSGGELEISASQPGYTSHRQGTRNLDTARAGDLDGDGSWEVLLPDLSYTSLGAVRHGEGGATVAWELPVGGRLVTNLASATDSGGRVSIAGGREDGVLRVWP